jgi:hypothetical protein
VFKRIGLEERWDEELQKIVAEKACNVGGKWRKMRGGTNQGGLKDSLE